MRSNIQNIYTHFGTFHADDVFAVAMLLFLFPNARVHRTRTPPEHSEGDLWVDLGGRFEPGKILDHHQKDGAGFRKNGVPFASFGLAWRAFGKPALKAIAEQNGLPTLTGKPLTTLHEKLGSEVVEFIDAADCGQVIFKTHNGDPPIKTPSISTLVCYMRPTPLIDPTDNESLDKDFDRAVHWAQRILVGYVKHAVEQRKNFNDYGEQLRALLNEALLSFIDRKESPKSSLGDLWKQHHPAVIQALGLKRATSCDSNLEQVEHNLEIELCSFIDRAVDGAVLSLPNAKLIQAADGGHEWPRLNCPHLLDILHWLGIEQGREFAQLIVEKIILKAISDAMSADYVRFQGKTMGDTLVLERYVNVRQPPVLALPFMRTTRTIIFPAGNEWMVSLVDRDAGRFPMDWSALTDERLAKASGVDDAIFCDRNGLRCSAKSKEGALQLATSVRIG